MKKLQSLAEAEEFIFSQVGSSLTMATPLGLGKPNQLINRIYDRVAQDKNLKLKIWTALSLDFAAPTSELEARFLDPFYARHFGSDYPHLKYVHDVQHNKLPPNISLHEFYFQAGSMLQSAQAQQNYVSLNYTHVTPAILQHEINVVVQLIAKSPDGSRYSLSSNPDLTLDVKDLYKARQRPLLLVGVVHPDLPFLGGDAEVEADFFTAILETPEVHHELFALPKTAEDEVEHMIGFYGSHLVEDDGTLQIGIGSLSDALVHSMILRHQRNALFKTISDRVAILQQASGNKDHLHRDVFHHGLYGTSEMIMDGFMHLRKAGILKREICDHEESARRYLHGAFFLGSKDFYHWLRHLEDEDLQGLSMTRVSKVNDLYDPHERALRRQRKKARFFNTSMNVTLLGAAASDTLEDGLVVSGVGGQYNFVAMAHELAEARSVVMLRSTREKGGKRFSNILPTHGQSTISRHLRDIVITEYGIAFLRGESDQTVIQRLLEISDSEFQPELLAWAQKNKKISRDYKLPPQARNNTPERIKSFIREHQSEGLFGIYPFGSDFTEEEIKIGKGLLKLKGRSRWEQMSYLAKGLTTKKEEYQKELERLDLFRPRTVKEQIYQKLVLGSLK